jgi:hypothetical protein
MGQAVKVSGIEVPPPVHTAMLTVRNWLGIVRNREGVEQVKIDISSSGRMEITDLEDVPAENEELKKLGLEVIELGKARSAASRACDKAKGAVEAAAATVREAQDKGLSKSEKKAAAKALDGAGVGLAKERASLDSAVANHEAARKAFVEAGGTEKFLDQLVCEQCGEED